MSNKIKIVIITGMSGAGKTHASDWFEDHGYYCIDNMPPALIINFLGLTSFKNDRISNAAFVVDVRSDEIFSDIDAAIEFLESREDIDFRMLFLEASNATLIRRYNETRRNHPLTNGRASQAVIEQERDLLSGLRQRADYVLDTTSMKVAEFESEMERMFIGPNSGKELFSINVISFGFKYGIPQEIDMTFDVRFIPNPYYVDSLRNLTGNNKKVAYYVMKYEVTRDFIKRTKELIEGLTPFYRKEGKNHLNIGFGCTGGQHRSVVMANEMARIFRESGYRVSLAHREL